MRTEPLTRSTPLDAKVTVIVEHAQTLAAAPYQLDELDVVQLLHMIAQTARAALPDAVQAALDAGATPDVIERVIARSERPAAVLA